MEEIFVKDAEFKTGMRTLLAWAMHKGFWTMFNVLFRQSAENLTPRLLKEKFTEIVVFHLIYRLIELHSTDQPNSLLGQETAKKLAKTDNPVFLCDVIRSIKWHPWDIEELSYTKPGGKDLQFLLMLIVGHQSQIGQKTQHESGKYFIIQPLVAEILSKNQKSN